jgi:putative spermidine/putrescine transport system permease protein
MSVWVDGILDRLARALYVRPRATLLFLLGPPLLWMTVFYVFPLLTLLIQSFFSLDDFSGLVRPDITLKNYAQLLDPASVDIFVRTAAMALAVTLACVLLAFPLAYYAARKASARVRGLLYLMVLLPLWSSYLIRVYAWKLILAQEGVVTWAAEKLGLSGVLQAILATPGIGGPSLSISTFGMFIVFVYVWLPYMILPIQTALERVPRSLLEASGDLGARPARTFLSVTLPLVVPGVIAGSIFTFSLTLGDFVVPAVLGNSSFFIGQAVLSYQGSSGNVPLAAAFTMVPIAIMIVYLLVARRTGAFDAL